MNDDQILQKGGTEDDINRYAEQNGADSKDIDLLVWDLETSGFVAPEAKILEIGAFIIRGDTIEEYRWVLDNKITIPSHITEINGMTEDIIRAEGRDPGVCLSEFLPLFRAAKKHVTHNGMRFDIPFLVDFACHVMRYDQNQNKAMKNFLRSTAFDTAVHYKAKKIGMKQGENEPFPHFADRVMNFRAAGVKYNLGCCCDEHLIDRANVVQHRALGDVFLTHELYKKITS